MLDAQQRPVARGVSPNRRRKVQRAIEHRTMIACPSPPDVQAITCNQEPHEDQCDLEPAPTVAVLLLLVIQQEKVRAHHNRIGRISARPSTLGTAVRRLAIRLRLDE
jgi:hypothetical protein